MLLERFIEIIGFFADVSNMLFLISGFLKFRGVSANDDVIQILGPHILRNYLQSDPR